MKFRKRIQQLAAISDRLPLPASSPRSIMTPTDVAAAFAKAWSKRDADAIADLFVEDADFVNVVGLWWRSKRSIRRAHAYGFEHAFGKATLKIDKVTERRLGDDVAVTPNKSRSKAADRSATSPRPPRTCSPPSIARAGNRPRHCSWADRPSRGFDGPCTVRTHERPPRGGGRSWRRGQASA